MSRPWRLKAAAHVPNRHLTPGIARLASLPEYPHVVGPYPRALAAWSTRLGRNLARGASVQLKSAPDGSEFAGLAEADPLPPEDARCELRGARLETLYRAHHASLVRFIRRHVRDERAQDVVQRVFCRLAGLSEQEQGQIAAPAAYLRRAAGNMLRDDARQAQRQAATQHVGHEEVDLVAADQVAGLEARDRLRRLEVALERLKPRTREIFLAHRFDGYSYAEIAARTGLSIKTVEMHMTRAIAYLAKSRGTP